MPRRVTVNISSQDLCVGLTQALEVGIEVFVLRCRLALGILDPVRGVALEQLALVRGDPEYNGLVPGTYLRPALVVLEILDEALPGAGGGANNGIGAAY